MQIRTAVIEDAKGIAHVHVNSWRTTYQGIVDNDYLDSLEAAKREEGWRWKLNNLPEREQVLVVTDENDDICGFMTYGPERERQLPHEGELYAIYLLEAAQGQGVGRQLFARMKEFLLAHGHTALMVWVLEGNKAEQFYRHLGGQERERKEIVIGSRTHNEIALVWDDLDQLGD
ncbi:GNAT family N-acetyltransferase [Paenibacillus sp. JCM 10914]|uniref:GNAT family N-acetyltransferase n=1 Tax=Paenibacillus sp. JCM 10914 TaxID=1236974 RepID=UPI0003CC4BDA|nr:GNAT family N-acetyltransferase [Paenibacillus sp. JCM 10914]GAE04995.1 GCN5-related N-acetyltransferase [Paenibacillus sp. JCM 10914]